MGATLNQPCRVEEDGPMGCKLLLHGNKGTHVWVREGTVRISIG